MQNNDKIKKIYDLFSSLNYQVLNKYTRNIENFNFNKDVKNKIKNIYSIFVYNHLSIFLIECSSIADYVIKSISLKISAQYLYAVLIFTEDYQMFSFVVTKQEKIDVGKFNTKVIKLNIDSEELNENNRIFSELKYSQKLTDRELFKIWVNVLEKYE